jgi:hypothetical protein
MFRASSRPSSGAQQLQLKPLVLPSERGGSSAVGRGQADRPDHDQQHCYHHTPTVKPEAATAVVKILMMGVRTPETCWAVDKRQVINWGDCCIWLVNLFEAFHSFLFWRNWHIVLPVGGTRVPKHVGEKYLMYVLIRNCACDRYN